MFGKRRRQDALQGGTAAVCGLHSWMKGRRLPGRRDGKLGWAGGTWLPRFEWHRMFLNREHSEDVALAPCLSNGRMSQQGHSSHLLPPRPWHTGATVIKRDKCFSRERINSFMFDCGAVRSARLCSYQFPGTTGGEEEAELVLSPVPLGWVACGGVAELKHLCQGTEPTSTMMCAIACHESSQVLRFVLRLGEGQVKQNWTLRAVLRPS